MSPSFATNRDFRLRPGGTAAPRRVLIALGVACLAISGLLMLSSGGRQHFIFSYLVAYLFFLTISLGSLFFVMLHHLAGARWSIVIRRLAESLMMNLPLLAILFIPIVIGLPQLYEWAHPQAVAHDPVLQQKAPYLNGLFFLVRALVYFGVWCGLAWVLYRRSLLQDATGRADLGESMRRWSAPGMLLFAVTLTFASFDWVMSLDARWYSTIFGVYVFSGAILAALAVLTLAAIGASVSPFMEGAISYEHFHDLGKLLFGFVIFWAYIAFSQMMLIWMANIPEETIWYAHRWQTPAWRAVSWFLIIGHFILPFLILLPRAIKRNRLTLALASLWLLLLHYVDLYWLVMPALHPQPSAIHRPFPLVVQDLFLLIGLGCIFFVFYIWRVERQPLAPVRDPHLADSLAFENV